MPLKAGRSKNVIGQNISELMHSGRPQKQSIAIAMSKAGMGRKGRTKGSKKTYMHGSGTLMGMDCLRKVGALK